MWRRIGRVAHGLIAGIVAGAIVTVGVVVVQARVFGYYLHGPGDVLGWEAVPAIALTIVGAWAGWRRPRLMGRAVLGAVVGLFAGVLAGLTVGVALGDPSATWAAAIVGAAVGLIGGAAASVTWAVRSGWWEGTADSPVEPGATRAAQFASLALVAGVVTTAWLEPGVVPAPGDESFATELPDPDAVESVIFLFGDAGDASPGSSPTLGRISEDIEQWSAALPDDSSVVAIALGDLIYPAGMSDTTALSRESDTLRIRAQMDIVRGEAARARGARAIFVAGNPDWGELRGLGGSVHLELLSDFLDAYAERGWAVELLPAAGLGGPHTVDVGDNLRIVVLDTAWWLLGGEEGEKNALLAGVSDALESAGPRRVVVAAHHPFVSGGPHGALVSFAGRTGFRMLTSKSGAMLQDLHSAPYRSLRDGLMDVFSTVGAPDLFAGGHEHSLQVIEGSGEGQPGTTLVSGSASKLTDVGAAPGMLYGADLPGYARLFVLRDGTMRLFVEATSRESLVCPEGETRTRCLAEGVDGFRTVWSGELPAADR